MGGDRCDAGSPRGAEIKTTLQAPLLESTHEAMAASRRWAEGRLFGCSKPAPMAALLRFKKIRNFTQELYVFK